IYPRPPGRDPPSAGVDVIPGLVPGIQGTARGRGMGGASTGPRGACRTMDPGHKARDDTCGVGRGRVARTDSRQADRREIGRGPAAGRARMEAGDQGQPGRYAAPGQHGGHLPVAGRGRPGADLRGLNRMRAWASAAEIAQAVAAGKTTALEVMEAALRRIAERDNALNAFTAVTRERALAKARAIDADRAAGRELGALAGVPSAVMNLCDVPGFTTLAGPKITRDRPPAGGDATLVRRLEAAGAVLVGALHMGEYRHGVTRGEGP